MTPDAPGIIPAVYGGNDSRGPRSVACTITAFQTTGRLDFETENFAVHAVPIQDCSTRDKAQNGAGVGVPGSPACTLDSQGLQGVAVVGPLTTGTTPNGHGQAGINQQAAQAGHIVPQAIPILEAGARTGTSTSDPRAGIGVGSDGDPMFMLQAGKQHAVATPGYTIPILKCSVRGGGDVVGSPGDPMFPVLAGDTHAVACFDERNVTSGVNRTRVEFGDPANTLHTKPLSVIVKDEAPATFTELGEGHHSYQQSTVAVALRCGDGGGAAKANLVAHAVAAPDVAAILTAGVSGPGVSPPGRRKEDDVNIVAHATPIDMRQASRGGRMTNNRAAGASGGPPGTGVGEEGGPAPSLSESHPPAVAYSISRDAPDRTGEGSGGTAGERSGLGVTEDVTQTIKAKGPNAVAYQYHGTNVGPMGTIRAGNGNETGGVPFLTQDVPADPEGVRFIHENQRGEITTPPIANSVTNGGGKPGQGYPCVSHGMTVRRLTPVECLRLQAMPDDHLDLEPPLSDSAKYRLCGNSGVANCLTFIGLRLRKAIEEAENG